MEDRSDKYLLEKPNVWQQAAWWGFSLAVLTIVAICLAVGEPDWISCARAGVCIGIIVTLVVWGILSSKTTTMYGHTIVFNRKYDLELELKKTRTFWTRRWAIFRKDCFVERYQEESIPGEVIWGPIVGKVTALPYMSVEGYAAQRLKLKCSSTSAVKEAAYKKLAPHLRALKEEYANCLPFDDPEDEGQQARFNEFILDYLQPLVNDDGITIEKAKFVIY